MTIQINRPEIEALVQQRLQSGAFQSAEDVISDALEVQAEREVWLQENKEAIHAEIERGLAQLDRGEGIAGEKLRDRLEADKEVLRRCPGGGKPSAADLALSSRRSGFSGGQPNSNGTGGCVPGISQRSRTGSQASRPNHSRRTFLRRLSISNRVPPRRDRGNHRRPPQQTRREAAS